MSKAFYCIVKGKCLDPGGIPEPDVKGFGLVTVKEVLWQG
jgi:hypothetical protein